VYEGNNRVTWLEGRDLFAISSQLDRKGSGAPHWQAIQVRTTFEQASVFIPFHHFHDTACIVRIA